MIPGDLLAKLAEVEFALPHLLAQPESWKSLDVLYEKPHVERLWQQFGDYRIYLHRIHAEGAHLALYHPHPWPSAVKIVSGGYDMLVGYGKHNPPVAVTLFLSPGSTYEMIEPDGWHAVQPRTVSLSLMVTGTPWERVSPGKGVKHPPLSAEVQTEILQGFQNFYRLA